VEGIEGLTETIPVKEEKKKTVCGSGIKKMSIKVTVRRKKESHNRDGLELWGSGLLK
jgi:hypothetical protein